MADVGVFGRYKGFADFQQEAGARNLEQALVQTKIAAAIKDMNSSELDIKKLGETGFLKASQGIEPDPLEVGAMRYLDAKSGGIQFDPVTGNQIQKPGLLDKIPLPGGAVPQAISKRLPQSSLGQRFTQAMQNPQTDVGGDFLAELAPVGAPPQDTPFVNEYDAAFEAEIAKAAGNPKLQQQLRADYAKDKYTMNESQTKAAGFADRMAQSMPTIESKTQAGLNPFNRIAGSIPLLGNLVAGADYRSFNQAQRDFINAQLRRESGAVINPDEFINAAQQYFPQVGDDPAVLEQKKANREAAFQGMMRSAGPAYKPPAIKTPQKPTGLKMPPVKAIGVLRQNASDPDVVRQFDEKYGKGAARYILGR